MGGAATRESVARSLESRSGVPEREFGPSRQLSVGELLPCGPTAGALDRETIRIPYYRGLS